ncbi:MAG: hypothetical protein KIT31_34730, partial [Deltaproteobacteria bacterium]|nr:hypothetical protein [Deltaproteobacteria bacterium]
RLALDLAGNRSWSVGVALQASEMTLAGSEAADVASYAFTDYRTVATVAYTAGTGSTQLRAEAGLGILHTSLRGHSFATMGEVDSSGFFPIGEAALHGILALGASWSVSAGPLVTIYSQEFRSSTTDQLMIRRDLDVAVLAQLRRRL